MESFEALSEIVGSDESIQMRFKLLTRLIIVTIDSGLFYCAIHSLNLTIGPGMIGLGKSVFDIMYPAYPVERMSPEHLLLHRCGSLGDRQIECRCQ